MKLTLDHVCKTFVDGEKQFDKYQIVSRLTADSSKILKDISFYRKSTQQQIKDMLKKYPKILVNNIDGNIKSVHLIKGKEIIECSLDPDKKLYAVRNAAGDIIDYQLTNGDYFEMLG